MVTKLYLTILIISNAISQLGKCHDNDRSKQTSVSIFENLHSKNFPTVTKSLPFFSHSTQEQSGGAETALKPWSKNEPKIYLFIWTHNHFPHKMQKVWLDWKCAQDRHVLYVCER